MDLVQEFGEKYGPEAVYAAGGACLLLALFLLRAIFSGGAGSQKPFLLVGPCSTGKTSFVYKACQGVDADTVTSMRETHGIIPAQVVGAFSESKRAIRVVDIPGHPRVMPNLVSKYLPRAKGIVIFVDSLGYQQSKKDTAQVLFDLLTLPAVQEAGIPIYAVCNKTDSPLSWKVKAIENGLQDELQRLIKAEDATFNGEEERVMLPSGFQLKEAVTFGEMSVKKAELGDIIGWMASIGS